MTDITEPELYVGVDGGASKTQVVVIDANGIMVDQAAGPASSLTASADHANETIRETLGRIEVLADRDPSTVRVGIGIAGTELSAARDRLLSLCADFADVCIVSDALVACLGAHGGADGAVIAIGTGVVGYRIEAEQTRQVTGWGFPHDDRGSGAWIGMEAIHTTLKTIDGRASPSPLTETILERFNHDTNEIIAWSCEADASAFARMAHSVADYAEASDVHACSILKRASDEVIVAAQALLDGCHPDLPLALSGGLAETLMPWVSDALGARLTPVQYSPAMGAALMMRNANLSSQLSDYK
ncbi:hypothetical protein HKX42_04490 [Salinisphaera sp. USBA-960]|uniref:BadF/BadG/BcrA/BcrD ATPase family protein n=1 Tax=Salinisphaera orenii TaxID=856731 RepID=UPI000DBE4070|nr:hypothetical protein [Salifodinibacter halophilus]NNC26133.1 hypothetical protein [Salifodinibacter halophilus]